MASTQEPGPIPLRAAERGLDAAGQERVALALTFMTQFALDATPAERAATAARIADALVALAATPELVPELQRLSQRLQRIWSAVQAQQEPM